MDEYFEFFAPLYPDFVVDDSVYNDIRAHCRDYKYYMDGKSKVTNAHEGCHGISGYLRNKLQKTGHNCFYVLQNRSITLVEPKIRKSRAAEYIPVALRDSRFNVYVVGAQDWDNQPLYLMDEFNAYLAGMDCAIYMQERWKYDEGWRDIAMGPLELLIYCVGLACALLKFEPTYFEDKKNVCFFSYQFNRCLYGYHKAISFWPHDRASKLFRELSKDIVGEAFRKILRDVFAINVNAEPKLPIDAFKIA